MLGERLGTKGPVGNESLSAKFSACSSVSVSRGKRILC